MATNEVAPLNPLNVPEIRTLIGQFLANRPPDLFSCALVSHAWFNDFIPQLWLSIRFDYHLSQLITQSTFRKYQHLIRNLFIHDPTFFLNGFYGDTCRGLTRLVFAPHIAAPMQIQSASISPLSSAVSINEDDNDDMFSNDIQNAPDENLDPFNTTTVLSRRQGMYIIRQFHALIEQQDSIEHLEEDWSHLAHVTKKLWVQPAFLLTSKPRPRLTTLTLSKWSTTTGGFNMVIAACPSLEYLYLRACEISKVPSHIAKLHPYHGEQDSEKVTFNDDSTLLDFGTVKILRLDQLCLNGDPIVIRGIQVEHIRVESFTIFYEENQYEYSGHPLKRDYTWQLPSVYSISFTGRGGNLHRTEAEDFINSILSPPIGDLTRTPPKDSALHNLTAINRPLMEITLNNCQLSESIFNNINQRLGDWIDLIDLSSCTGLESAHIQQVLVYCGNLRVFRGPEVYYWTREMFIPATGQSWASSKLQELVMLTGIGAALDSVGSYPEPVEDLSCVDIILEQDSTRRSVEVIFEQLSRQHSLEILDLSGGIDFYLLHDCRKGVPLTLKAGLDRLRMLKNIRHVIVTGWEDEMGVAEAEWMKTFWLKLETIHSREGGTSEGWRQFENKINLP
ncbi:hypothetical protein BGZ80_003604, partial [Entomortierella chlamydospora]